MSHSECLTYTGNKARDILEINLEETDNIEAKGYYYDFGKWIAFDNETSDCFVEEFRTEAEAIAWTENYFDMSEYDDFKIKTIFRGLYFIRGIGLLKVNFKNNMMTTKLITIPKIRITLEYPR